MNDIKTMASQRKDVQINLRVPPELAEMLDREARKTRTNRSWVIREALHRYLGDDDRPPDQTND